MFMDKAKHTRACLVQDLRPDFVSIVQKYISSSDNILACYETKGTYKNVGFIFDYNRAVYIIQIITKRLLIYGWSGGFRNHETPETTVLQLRDIKQIHEGSNWNYWSVNVLGQSNNHIECTFTSQKFSQDFASILFGAMEQEKTEQILPSQSPSLASIEDSIERLSNLHKKGIISDIEFQEKRKELLNQI
jgi:hypothetical protein